MGNKKKKVGIGVAVIAIALVVAVGALMMVLSMTPDSSEFMDVQYKTQDGEVISGTSLSMIGETYGISDMRFTINVKNVGNVPLDASIESSSPTQLTTSLSSATTKPINPGETVSWTTDWIATQQFEGATPTFEAVILATDTLGRSVTKSGSKTISIMPDPEIGIEVTVTGSEGESEANPGSDPGACTDECTFTGNDCVGGDLYSCVTGTDGCKDLVLVEDCGTDGCSASACVVPGTCTSQVFTDLGSPCVFDCTDSQEDCPSFYSVGVYSTQGPVNFVVPKGTSQVKTGYNCKITKCI